MSENHRESLHKRKTLVTVSYFSFVWFISNTPSYVPNTWARLKQSEIAQLATVDKDGISQTTVVALPQNNVYWSVTSRKHIALVLEYS